MKSKIRLCFYNSGAGLCRANVPLYRRFGKSEHECGSSNSGVGAVGTITTIIRIYKKKSEFIRLLLSVCPYYAAVSKATAHVPSDREKNFHQTKDHNLSLTWRVVCTATMQIHNNVCSERDRYTFRNSVSDEDFMNNTESGKAIIQSVLKTFTSPVW